MRRPHEHRPRLASRLALLLACWLAVLARTRAAGGVGMPANFIFGDSLVDAGNNNYIVSLSKANYPPNGIDFFGHQPTGRYTNGRTIIDILGAIRTQSLCLIFDTRCYVTRTLHCIACQLIALLNFSTFFLWMHVSSGQEMGLGGLVPPYMAPETTGDAVMRGVNYASGGGGILNQTGSIFVSTWPPPNLFL